MGFQVLPLTCWHQIMNGRLPVKLQNTMCPGLAFGLEHKSPFQPPHPTPCCVGREMEGCGQGGSTPCSIYLPIAIRSPCIHCCCCHYKDSSPGILPPWLDFQCGPPWLPCLHNIPGFPPYMPGSSLFLQDTVASILAQHSFRHTPGGMLNTRGLQVGHPW